MARSRTSAKKAGAAFERQIADHLAQELDDRIDRRVKTGAHDRGDIGGVRTPDGRKIVIETKNYGGRLHPAEWVKEAHTERDNDGAAVGIVIAKRKGTTNPAKQWCLMEVEDLVELLRPLT